jgi:adenylate kinase family enzyme
MIVLLCGPSGSGKTTLLHEIGRRTSYRVIDVAVGRDCLRGYSEVGKSELSIETFERLRPNFEYQYNYDNCLYGFSIDVADVRSDEYVFVDYPGEYPDCSELNLVNWRGILVLPPDESILRKRLIDEKREKRIASAVSEYAECLEELARGVYVSTKWRIYISSSTTCMDNLLDDVICKTIFA